jgi:hypothetical protein
VTVIDINKTVDPPNTTRLEFSHELGQKFQNWVSFPIFLFFVFLG